MIITISGIPGSGKDTVGKKIADKLGYKFYSMGDLWGELAIKKGMNVDELNDLAEKEGWVDKETDDYQKELGEKEDNFVIVGRTSFHFIPKSVKVFLDVDIKVGAERIMGDERPDEKYNNVEEAVEHLKQREASDVRRYKKYYDLDILDKDQYDICVDTSELTPDEVVEKVLECIKESS